MKYRITESALRGMIREAVQDILTEYGDSHKNGRYGAAMDAYYAARGQGRYRQADNFLDYAQKAFNDDYGFETGNGYGGRFGVEYMSDENIPLYPYFADKEYGRFMDLTDPTDTDAEKRMQRRANDLKTKQRKRMKKGVSTWRDYNMPDDEK